MIDLRNRILPNTISVNGGIFSIKTDFREWLKFGELIQGECKLSEFHFLFKNDIPKCDFAQELFDFYQNENARPRKSGHGSNTKVVDFILDGEYIYSSFRQQYGINLLKEDLHWHEFKALFNGLTESTKMVQIMQMAGYEKTNKSIENQQQEMKEMWSFGSDKYELSEEEINDLKEEFYGCL